MMSFNFAPSTGCRLTSLRCRRMSFDDFSKEYQRLEVCHLGPDTMNDDGEINAWEGTVTDAGWRRHVSAGGCRNYPGDGGRAARAARALRAPATGDRRPATGDRRPATGDRRPATGDRRPATGDRRPATGDRRPATGDRRPATGDRRPATGDRRPATGAHLVPLHYDHLECFNSMNIKFPFKMSRLARGDPGFISCTD